MGYFVNYIINFKRRSHLNVAYCIDELRYIVKLSNAPIIEITESKLDNYVLDSEVQIDSFQIFDCDRDKKREGVVCYIKNDLGY